MIGCEGICIPCYVKIKNKNNAGTVWAHKMANQTLSLLHAVFFDNTLYMQLAKNILLNNTLKS
jgi:hypothetical protein